MSKVIDFILFHLVLTVIEWLWNRIFDRNKLIQHANVMPKVYAGETAVLRGCNIFARLYNHRYLGIGLWLLPFLFVWGILNISWASMILAALQYRSLFMVGYAVAIWAVEITLSFLIWGHYARNKYEMLFYVLFPFYFISFPFLLVYSKLLQQ